MLLHDSRIDIISLSGLLYTIFFCIEKPGEIMDHMTKEEMQRFLNREAEKGSTEAEALKALADILGIKFPELGEKRNG